MHCHYYDWVPAKDTSVAVFDIETNGRLEDTTVIHSLVIKDPVSGMKMSCSDHDGFISIEDGLKALAQYEVIVGHNIICFDIPAIKRVCPGWKPRAYAFDTLNACRMIWPKDVRTDQDFRFVKHNPWFPKAMIGRHSLESWGYRLGYRKDEFGKTTDWQTWTPEMQSYCEQDVEVTVKLYQRILDMGASPQALALEMHFQELIFKQEQFGFPFNVAGAQALYATLAARRTELYDQLQSVFPPARLEEVFIPKVNNKTKGYVKGQPFIRVKEEPFKPSSREHIACRLIDLGWTPAEWGDDGCPTINDDLLESLEYPEAKPLAEYLMVEKRISQIAEGKKAWLKLEQNGRIHGGVITNGAVSGRCTHNNPNVAQVPTNDVPYGKECRALFSPPPGWVQVGADASGLELRNLGHYMAPWDDGAYIAVILDGDIHWVNAKALAVVPNEPYDKHNEKHLFGRNKVAKRFIYAFCYGAGDIMLGSIINPHGTEDEQRAAGKKLRASFLKGLPAMGKLIDAVKTKATKQGWIKGIDGRALHIRSAHSALNQLLQSAGAILVKLASVFAWWMIEERGYVFGKDWALMAHIHDELQVACRPEIADEIGQIIVHCIRMAGLHFCFRCPMDGEYKIGANWSETH